MPGKKIQKGQNKIEVETPSGRRVTLNDQSAVAVHTSCFEGMKDLLLLGDFNENTSLHNIRVRYAKDQIYTAVGVPILISFNPYKRLPIYTKEIAQNYRQLLRNPENKQKVEPHLFQIAEMSFQALYEENINQSIIISGESGSGKTEATKYMLK